MQEPHSDEFVASEQLSILPTKNTRQLSWFLGWTAVLGEMAI